MNTEELIQTCRDRNELEFLFLITKRIAETDSIGEGHIIVKNIPKNTLIMPKNILKHRSIKIADSKINIANI